MEKEYGIQNCNKEFGKNKEEKEMGFVFIDEYNARYKEISKRIGEFIQLPNRTIGKVLPQIYVNNQNFQDCENDYSELEK